jgi:four helix bundle protein
VEVFSYRDLSVRQLAMQLTEAVYATPRTFPQSELYALANQLQRAAVSIPSNIAEGHARNTTRDYMRFVSIAMGSLAEVETQIELAARLNYLGIEQRDALFTTTDELGRMLQGLRKSLQGKLDPSPSP